MNSWALCTIVGCGLAVFGFYLKYLDSKNEKENRFNKTSKVKV